MRRRPDETEEEQWKAEDLSREEIERLLEDPAVTELDKDSHRQRRLALGVLLGWLRRLWLIILAAIALIASGKRALAGGARRLATRFRPIGATVRIPVLAGLTLAVLTGGLAQVVERHGVTAITSGMGQRPLVAGHVVPAGWLVGETFAEAARAVLTAGGVSLRWRGTSSDPNWPSRTDSRSDYPSMGANAFPVDDSTELWPSVVVSAVDGQPVQSRQLKASGRPSVRGKVFNVSSKSATMLDIFLASHRVGDDTWRLVGGPGPLTQSESGGWFDWQVDDVALAPTSEGRGPYEIVAVAVPRSGDQLPRGVLDRGSLERCGVGVSAAVRVICTSETQETRREEEPRIRIAYVGRQPVDPDDWLPAGLEEPVEGEAHTPDESFVHVLVRPLKDDQVWIMPERGTVHGRRWSGIAFLGRPGMDRYHLFRVTAVISSKQLPVGSASPQAWQRHASTILAESEEVKMIRVIDMNTPTPRARIAVTRIDDGPVTGTRSVDIESRVEGTVEGFAGSSDTIWVLWHRRGTLEWTVAGGPAVLLSQNYWVVPVTNLGSPGQHLTILGVVCRGALVRGKELRPGIVLGVEDILKLNAVSRNVYVTTFDRVPQKPRQTQVRPDSTQSGVQGH